MSSINGISGTTAVNPLATPVGRVSGSAASSPSRGSDRVELSVAAGYVQSLRDNNVRADKIGEIRAQLEAGKFDEDAKLDVVVDRLLEDLDL
jgi:anti-sigma28 factor (negative regulator of flagellin synthesis)